jgi:metallo-beta-lactamase class B
MARAMYAKLRALLALALTACAPVAPVKTISSGATLASQCQGRDGWGDPAPPAHIFANVYMVGTCGIVSLLVTSPKGHILIDGATAEAAPFIADNIRTLGFQPSDVKYLVSSHEHLDHVGGLAALKDITGARMLARAEARKSLETGISDPTDPQLAILPPFAGIKVDQIVSDGETITLGPIKMTAIATPGHAPGGTSWTWKSCAGAICHQFVFADSLGAVSADGYRFTDHPAYVAVLRATMKRVAELNPCDVLIAPHPAQSRFFERVSGKEPLADPAGCANYAKAAMERLDARLAKEAAQ